MSAASSVEEHCADVAGGRATESAEALAEVTQVLAEVSRAHDQSGAVHLLYWRGVLNSCIGQAARGGEDLRRFLGAVEADPAYAAQVQDSRVRLRRLERSAAAAPRGDGPRPGLLGGSIALGAAGLLGGLSGWQEAARTDAQEAFEEGRRPWADTESVGIAGSETVTTSRVLLAASLGTASAGIVLLGLSAANQIESPSVAPLVAPRPEGGLVLGLMGRW